MDLPSRRAKDFAGDPGVSETAPRCTRDHVAQPARHWQPVVRVSVDDPQGDARDPYARRRVVRPPVGDGARLLQRTGAPPMVTLASEPVSWWGVDSRVWFTGIVVLVALERVVELRIARRNARWSFARGGREYGSGHYPVMVALHSSLLVPYL